MNWFPWFTDEAWVPFVKALLHTFWQGALVAAVLYAVLKAVPARRADLRYGVSVAALLAVVLCAFVTWALLEYRQTLPKTQESAELAPAGLHKTEGGAFREDFEAKNKASAPAVASRDSTPTAGPAGSGEDGNGLSHLAPWAAGVWFVGVALMISRAIVLVIGAGRLRRRCRPIEDTAVTALVDRLRKALGIARRVRVRVGEQIDVPAVLGVVWPTVLLPASMLSGVPVEQLRAVIAHELAHIRRFDYLVNLAQMLIEAFLFFNPMVWWISRRIRIEREACCDALAAGATGDNLEYARALSEVATTLRAPAFALHAAQAMTGPPESRRLLDRVKRIVTPGHRPHLRLPWYTLVGVLTLSAVILIGVWGGSKASVTLAARILSPEERIRKINEIGETHKPPEEDRNRQYSLAADGITVSGVVRTEDGLPLAAVDVQATSRRPGYTAGHTINLQLGRFSQKVHFGKVYIRANAEGYAPAFAGPLEAEPGAEIEDIQLILRRGFEGRVKVVDESGAPLKGVDLSGTFDHGCAHPGVAAVTDSAGIAVFDHCSTMPLTLHAGVTGYQTDTRTIAFRPRKLTTWQLKRSDPASGVVVSAETGQPIPDASLCLLRITGPHSRGWSAESAEIIATTDDNGRFVLDRLRSDSQYTFFVEALGHGRAFLRKVMAGQTDLKVELGPEIYVRGKITGSLEKLEKRRGAMGLQYTNPYQVEEGSSYSSMEWIPIDLRDNEAHFEIRNLFAGTVRLYTPGETKTLNLQKAVDDLVIEIPEAEPKPGQTKAPATRQVVLRFEVPEGSPMPTGELTVTYISDDGNVRQQLPIQVPIEDGVVRVDVPAPTRIGYRNDGMVGYWIKELWSEEVKPANEPFEMTVQAIPAGAIYGAVAEADGSPARSSFVAVAIAERSPLMPQGSLGVDVKNSVRGEDDLVSKFMAAPLPLGGKYVITLHRDQTYVVSDPIELTGAEPTKKVDLRYVDGTAVEGRVLMPDGSPASGIRFRFEYNTPYGSFSGARLWTDREGRFSLQHVNPQAPGTYSIVIKDKPGCRPASIKVTPDGKPLTIRLERGHVVTGVVLDDKTGWPIPGVEVYALAHPDTRRELSGYIDADAKTNERGEFRFSTLDAYEYSLSTRAGRRAQPSGELIAKGGQEQPVTIRIYLYEWSKLQPHKPEADAQPEPAAK